MKTAVLLLGTLMTTAGFGVTGKSRVVGTCYNVADPKFKTTFELDSRNEPTNDDNVLGHGAPDPKTGKVRALRVKAALWGAGPLSDYASSINFRIELAALQEIVVDESVLQTYSALDHRHFSLTEKEAVAGKDWETEFTGDDYKIKCAGRAQFSGAPSRVDLSDGKLHAITAWDSSRINFYGHWFGEARSFCGVTITSTDPDVEQQRNILNWIWITTSTGGHQFHTGSSQLFPIRENIRLGKGAPSLRFQFPSKGEYLSWEASVRADGKKRSLFEAMAHGKYPLEAFQKLQAQAITCDPE